MSALSPQRYGLYSGTRASQRAATSDGRHRAGAVKLEDSGQWAHLPELAPILASTPVAAFVVALLRSFYEGREKRNVRRVLEALLCAFISSFVMAAIVIFAILSDLKLPVPDKYWLIVIFVVGNGVGSFVGFLGADETRSLIRKVFSTKILK